jgi:ABC-type polysaccharide/polyol phosphate transport system ATPase subunit
MEKKISEKRRTVVIANGNLKFLREHCNKLIWLEGGKIKKQGEPKEVIREYKAYIEKTENNA